MAYRISSAAAFEPISEVSTTQKHPLGTQVEAHDADKGSATFVYAKGVASTVPGSVVTFGADFATALLANTAASGLPVGVAMAAIGAGQFGWYAIKGRVPAKVAAAVVAGAAVYASGTAGSVDDLAAPGDLLAGAAFASADAAGLADVLLACPHFGTA